MSKFSQAWATLFGLQASANDVLAGPNWRTNPTKYDYRAALMDEVVEARLAAGYAPFWSGGKKPEFDGNNLKLELVDILHFLMSEVLQGTSGPVEEFLNEVGASFDRGYYRGALELDWNPGHLYGMLGQLYLKEGTLAAPYWAGAAVYHFGAACGNIGLSFDELYGKYIAKNALNVFRKSIGYKQDKSVKFWVNPTPLCFRGKVDSASDLGAMLVDEGDYAAVESEGGERYIKSQGNVVKYSEARIEDNAFVMQMLNAKIAAGEDLLTVTYDEMVGLISNEYTRVTGKAAV